jgi:hypothetical protein
MSAGVERTVGGPVKKTLLCLGLALAALTPPASRADVGPPAHLRISEREPGLFVTEWRVPRVLPPKAVPVPDLPETCEPVGDYSVEVQARAWLFTQDWRCDTGLAGEPVGMRFPFADLALTTVVRVNLLSGDRFAHVLTPGEGSWRLPKGTAAPDRLRDAARAVVLGAAHVFGSWAHLPFVLAVGLLGGIRRSIRVVTAFTLGQLLGAAAAVPAPGLGVVPAEIAIGITAALLAREALRVDQQRRRLVTLAAVAGVVHGLAIGTMLVGSLGGGTAGIVMQLLALLGMDAGHLVGAAGVAALAALVTKHHVRTPARKGLVYASGAAGVALALGLALGGAVAEPKAGQFDVATPEQQSAGRGATGTGSRRLAPAAPDAPIQSYLVIEPFEVRHEAMLRLGGLAETLGPNPYSIIEVDDQAALSERITSFVLDRVAVRVDGVDLPGIARRVDFMMVDATGALPRTTPVPESMSEAVVGVVVTYPTAGMPREVSLTWDPFPTAMETIPATMIDPESVVTATLSVVEPALIWENTLVEDPIPTVAAVAVEPLRLPVPLISLPLLAAAVIVLIVGSRRRRVELSIATTRVVLALALVVGPLARTTVALPASAAGAPSERQARRILAGLLPNIYRAMEYRDERLIYDRLAVSVTGETLTEIYLEQRRTLELEERGGAQARVEAVEILDAKEIERQETGFHVRSTWTVGGMVTHFGHRHFRQNRYDARIAIVPLAGTWKIRSIEVLEQDRLR